MVYIASVKTKEELDMDNLWEFTHVSESADHDKIIRINLHAGGLNTVTNDFERVIHAFISSRLWLDYCKALHVGVSQAFFSCLHSVQNAAACLLTRTFPLAHWLPVHFTIDFRISLFAYKSLNGLAPNMSL